MYINMLDELQLWPFSGNVPSVRTPGSELKLTDPTAQLRFWSVCF